MKPLFHQVNYEAIFIKNTVLFLIDSSFNELAFCSACYKLMVERSEDKIPMPSI